MAIFEQELARQAALDEQQRLRRMQRQWEAYYGKFPRPLRVRPGDADDCVVANKARVVINHTVHSLYGQPVTWELDDAVDSAPEKYLAAVWAANRQMTLLQKAAITGAVTGHIFIKIRLEQPYPRLLVLDPAMVSVRWAPDDVEQVERYVIQYSGLDPKTAKPQTYRQVIERDGAAWHLTDQVSAPDSAIWVTTSEETWAHPWSPILDCQNLPAPGSFWGMSDIEEDLLSLNKARNFVLSNWIKINRYHGHPRTWARGIQAKQIETSVDGTLVFPSEHAELRSLEMASDQAGASTLDRRLDEAIHEMSATPAVVTGKLETVGNLSGTALALLLTPLIMKTETKRRLQGDLLVELNRRLLALGGFGEDHVTTLQWPELLPSDPLAEAQTLAVHHTLGVVSTDTLASKLGYDYEVEKPKIAAEDAAAVGSTAEPSEPTATQQGAGAGAGSL